jgi:hypothetical protein
MEQIIRELPLNRDIYCLTFDEPYSGHIQNQDIKSFYLPDSSWSEGRNHLLEKAAKGSYRYFIFLDSDARVISGTYSQFEDLLMEYNPIVGIPLSDQIESTWRYNKKKKVQAQKSFDQLVQAYDRKAIIDGICLPFDGRLDHESWWYSCEINQYLIFAKYKNKVLQFNEIKVFNSNHTTAGNEQDGSKYKGGVTRKGLDKCKKMITEEHGKQPRWTGTLFHPWYLPKPIYGPTFTFIVRQDVEIKEKVRAFIKFFVSKPINLAAILNDLLLDFFNS